MKNETVIPKEKIWICGTCEQEFSTKQKLIEHLEERSEIFSVLKSDVDMAVKKREKLRKRILKEMMIHKHKETE